MWIKSIWKVWVKILNLTYYNKIIIFQIFWAAFEKNLWNWRKNIKKKLIKYF